MFGGFSIYGGESYRTNPYRVRKEISRLKLLGQSGYSSTLLSKIPFCKGFLKLDQN